MNQADIILINAHVLTMSQTYQRFNPGAVAIKGQSIVAVGAQGDIMSSWNAPEIMDCSGKVIMPGLINAHTHVPMTLLRGLADDLRLDVWLMGYMMPVERQFVTPEFVRLGTLIACAEMIRGGTTCFVDMYYFEKEVARATAEAGLRAICGESILKFPTPDATSFEESLAYSQSFIDEWKNHPLIVPAVAPHAPYTCTAEILRLSTALAVKNDVPLVTHLSETALEVENMRSETGMPVIPYVKKQGIFEAKVIAAHCVHIDEGEMRTMQKVNVGIAHNPSSNLKLASGIAPVKKMSEVGLNVGIGTDGPASNNDLDMFEEMRLTSLLSKGASGDPTVLPARQALAMATRIGAQAIHLEHITGSLEPGKRADLILLDVSPLHNAPQFFRDPNGIYAQIVYAAKSTDVSDVMVNGCWLMTGHRLITLNEEELLSQAAVFAKKIDAFLAEREQSILSKLIAIGGAAEQESFEVQVKVKITDPQSLLQSLLSNTQIEIIRHRHYHQYDTYFSFDDPKQGRLRYREDHLMDDNHKIVSTRSRLTLIGTAREEHFPKDVLLSRSRYLAPAVQSLRFYHEYFNPSHIDEIEKDRDRFLVKYRETEFFINIDEVMKPSLAYYLEIKSSTWSRNDAANKSKLVAELISLLGADPTQAVAQDYIELIRPNA